jgi:hypothetical protein
VSGFDVHPLLVLAMGLLALPLLLDAGHRTESTTVLERGRTPLGLAAAGVLSALVALALGQWPGTAVREGWGALPWLLIWLSVPGLALILVEPLVAKVAGREVNRAWPALLVWPLLEVWPGFLPTAASRAAAVGLGGAMLLLLLRGVLERFRQNRPPRGLDGVPVRLLALGAMLWLAAGWQSLLAGRLP